MPHTHAPNPSPLACHWRLEQGITFLNHGSFGATPAAVLRAQDGFRARMESEPVRFMVEELEPLLDESRRALAEFVGADTSDLVFVPNATAGVNAVVRSLKLNPGDELLSTTHGYNACLNTFRFAAEQSGARVVLAEIPFPIRSGDQAADAILAAVTPRTRLAMICHVTSPTALVLPIKRIVDALAALGVDTLVDAAHAPGMLPVDIRSLNAAYYSANCHKWMCTPKGSAFLHVRRDKQAGVRPHIISHGANSSRTDRSRFQLEFDWTGTSDFTPWLCMPEALRAMASFGAELPGPPLGTGSGLNVGAAWERVRTHNRELVLAGRRLVAAAVGTELPAPDEMIGSIAAIQLAPGRGERPPLNPYYDPLQRRLVDEFRIQAPVNHFPAWPRRSIRISAQLYNDIGQYEYLAEALKQIGKR